MTTNFTNLGLTVELAMAEMREALKDRQGLVEDWYLRVVPHPYMTVQLIAKVNEDRRVNTQWVIRSINVASEAAVRYEVERDIKRLIETIA